MRKPWWQHEAAIAWALILFFPLGILMMWLYAPWRNRFKWLWTTVAVIVLLVVIAGAIGGGETEDSLSSVSSNTTPQSGVIASPTMTIQELAYIEAIAAQEPEHAQDTQPPSTLEPTNAPEPTPVPKLTDEECDYLNEVAEEYAAPLSESLPRFANLSQQAASDPTLIFDDEWRMEVVIELAIWSVSRDGFAAMTPPSSLVGFHAKFLDALARLDSAATLFAEGIDEVDTEKINRASAQMSEGAALLNEANDLLSEFQSQHPGGC